MSLLDTACARVALSQSATPPAVEDCRRDIEHLRPRSTPSARGGGRAAHDDRLAELTATMKKAEERKADLEKQLEEERKLAVQVTKLRLALQNPKAAEGTGDSKHGERPATAAEAATVRELLRLQEQLTKLQGETPLVHPVVDRQAVADVVSGWTGIPVGKMVLDEIKTVLSLQEKLEERVIGQSHALEAIAQRIRRPAPA